MQGTRHYYDITPDRKPEFVERGYKGRYFFPHRVYVLPRTLSEQHRIAKQKWAIDRPEDLYCLLLFADPGSVAQFPEDLFFDTQIMIHRDHLGLAGLAARAYLYIDGDTLCCDEHQSDLVQRAAQRMEHRGKINRRFGGWHQMLLNSVLNFAVVRGLKTVRIPCADRVLSKYIKSNVEPDLFERIYDRDTQMRFDAKRDGEMWVIDVEQNRGRLIEPVVVEEPKTTPAHSVCLLHEVEAIAEVDTLLDADRAAGVHATYLIPPALAHACRDRIESQGHAVGFHCRHVDAYRYPGRPIDDEPAVLSAVTQTARRIDYNLRKRLKLNPGFVPTASRAINTTLNRLRTLVGQPPTLDTLDLCRREEDYVYGYRQTEHDTAAGLTDERLRDHHFAWVLCDRVGEHQVPTESQRLFKAPVTCPWSAAVSDRASFDGWAEGVVRQAGDAAFSAIELPASHASVWLDGYASLVESLRASAEPLTVEQLTDRHYLDRAVSR